jgi:hypothetical protein
LIKIKRLEREMKKSRREFDKQAEPQADGLTVNV